MLPLIPHSNPATYGKDAVLNSVFFKCHKNQLIYIHLPTQPAAVQPYPLTFKLEGIFHSELHFESKQ